MSDLIFVRPIFVFIRGRFGPYALYHPSCSSKYSKAILFHSGDFFFVFRVDDLSWFELNNDEDDSLEFFDRLRKFAQCFLTTTSVRDNRFYCLRIRSSSFNCMPTHLTEEYGYSMRISFNFTHLYLDFFFDRKLVIDGQRDFLSEPRLFLTFHCPNLF